MDRLTMWTTDNLSSEERNKIFALVSYIKDRRRALHVDSNALHTEHQVKKLMECIADCPKIGIYFKVYEDVRGLFKPSEYMNCDEVVPLLFDKVELGRWKIINIEHYPQSLVSANGQTKYDKVEIWITNSPHMYGPLLDENNNETKLEVVT